MAEDLSNANNEEIDPIEKLEKLKEILKDYNVTVHTVGDEEYPYLQEGWYCLAVENQSGEKLFIDWDGEFSLFYDHWHAHFSPCQQDYEEMLEYLTGILQNKLCVFSMFSNNEWLGSAIFENSDVRDKMDAKKYVKSNYSKAVIYKIKQNGAEVRFVCWDSGLNNIIKFEPGEF